MAKRGQAGGQIPLAKPRVRLALFGSLSLHLADVEFDVRCRKVRALVDYEIEPSAATQELAVAIKRWLIGASGDCIALIPSAPLHNKTSDDGIYLQAWVRACASPPRRWENSSTYRIWHHVLFEVGLRAGHSRGSPCPGNSRVRGSPGVIRGQPGLPYNGRCGPRGQGPSPSFGITG